MSSQTCPVQIRIAPTSTEELRSLFESELRHRRLFVRETRPLQLHDQCALIIEHPLGGCLALPAEAVFIKEDDPGAGIGLELTNLDATGLEALEQFVRKTAPAAPVAPEAQVTQSLHERIRQLSLRERDQVARHGAISERIALERVFGSSVWETLLQNPQLSIPEVARIAMNGTLPIPLVNTIVSKQSWLSSGEIRRALLSNPRVSGANLDRVLRAIPRSELKQIAQQSPYRAEVRAAAKRLVTA